MYMYMYMKVQIQQVRIPNCTSTNYYMYMYMADYMYMYGLVHMCSGCDTQYMVYPAFALEEYKCKCTFHCENANSTINSRRFPNNTTINTHYHNMQDCFSPMQQVTTINQG